MTPTPHQQREEIKPAKPFCGECDHYHTPSEPHGTCEICFPTNTNWEDEVDRLFLTTPDRFITFPGREVKEFISGLLSTAKEEERKRVLDAVEVAVKYNLDYDEEAWQRIETAVLALLTPNNRE